MEDLIGKMVPSVEQIRSYGPSSPWADIKRRGSISPLAPHILAMTWHPPKKEPAKTKAELYEMLAEAVRNTNSKPEPKPRPKVRKDRS
jgi:hypothetical protein